VCVGCVQTIDEVRHPQLASLFGFVEQPDAARMAVALLHEPLRELTEKAVDVRLANEELERKLHGAVLNLDETLGATAVVRFAHERGA
jgi:hypothetical protein